MKTIQKKIMKKKIIIMIKYDKKSKKKMIKTWNIIKYSKNLNMLKIKLVIYLLSRLPKSFILLLFQRESPQRNHLRLYKTLLNFWWRE